MFTARQVILIHHFTIWDAGQEVLHELLRPIQYRPIPVPIPAVGVPAPESTAEPGPSSGRASLIAAVGDDYGGPFVRWVNAPIPGTTLIQGAAPVVVEVLSSDEEMAQAD